MFFAMRDLFPGSSVQELVVSAKPGWNAFNPAIAESPTEGYKILVRSSNYVLDVYGQYSIDDPTDAIRTRYFIGTMDSTLNLVDLQPVIPCSWGEIAFPQVRGLE